MSDPITTANGTITADEAAAQRKAYVDALRYERDGYLARGQKDLAAGVDAELARAEGAPRGRKSPDRAAVAPSAAAAASDAPGGSNDTKPAPSGRQRPAARRRKG